MDIILISIKFSFVLFWLFCFFADESCVAKRCVDSHSRICSAPCLFFISILPWPHLAVRPEASLLKPGPDTLDSASVLWMTGGVAADTLVLLHQRVIHQTYKRTQIRQDYYNSPTTLGVVSSFTFYIINKRSCGEALGRCVDSMQ